MSVDFFNEMSWSVLEQRMRRPRRYRSLQDLARMRALLMAGRRAAKGSYYVHIGDLNWWLFYSEKPADLLWHVYLWEQGDQLAGWALLSLQWRTFDVFVHPALRGSAQAIEMYAWAQARLTSVVRDLGGQDIRTMWIDEQDQAVGEMLLEQGFAPEEGAMLVMERSLAQRLPSFSAPQGYDVRNVAGEDEAAARAQPSHAAFKSSWEIERYIRRYRNFMRAPVYMPDLDLVTIAPDGRHASFCLCWPDPVNKIGLFEPVGTHPQYQRLGLGRAVMGEGLRRLQARGMTHAMVCAEMDNPAAQALYASAGFETIGRLLTYVKPI